MPKRLFTAGLVAALALPALAQAHSASPIPNRDSTVAATDEVPDRVERALGGEVTTLPNGLYRVESATGETFTTHGPDRRREMLADADGDGVPDLSNGPERPPACIANPGSDYYQRVLYGYPTNGANNLAAHKADIQAQVRRNNWLINDQSLASGGPEADFTVLCDGGGEIDVTAFPVTPDLAGTNASFERVVTEAQNAGFTNARVDYTIFYDGNGPACGVGYLYWDDSPGVNNLNNNPGFTGAGYGMSYKACWFGRTSIHENAHNEGAAQQSAPSSTGNGGHCNEDDDILCYVDGGNRNQSMVPCGVQPGIQHYDCAWNTYFDSVPEPGEWLANHWNIGSTVNRFIRFGADNRVPETTILSGPGQLATEATFRFESSEAPATFECSLVAEGSAPSFSGCGSPQSYTGIPDGAYVFSVRSTDSAGNTDQTPAMSTFTFDAPEVVAPRDATPPETTITRGPGDVLRAKRARATARFAFASDEPAAQFQCRLDDRAFTHCATSQAYRVGRGKHTFTVVAIDASGNVDPTPARDSFKVKRKRKHR